MFFMVLSHFAESHFTESHFAGSHFAESHFANSHFAESHFADSHFAESYFADSHFAESHFAESHNGWRLQTVLPLDSSTLPIHIIATTSYCLDGACLDGWSRHARTGIKTTAMMTQLLARRIEDREVLSSNPITTNVCIILTLAVESAEQ